jgi:hypothetical protein
MSNEDLDLRQLLQRGWTRRMVQDLLGKEDYRATVNHFRNFSGKKMFERKRVEGAEASEEFRSLFTASAKRRGFSRKELKEVLARSQALQAAGAQWKGPPPRPEPPCQAAPASPQAVFSILVNYAVDVGPRLLNFPNSARFWIGFEWQASIGRWLAHCGRPNEFRLISPAVLRSLIRQARELQLLVTSYRANRQPS